MIPLIKLDSPLKDYFTVSTTVMLDYGFKDIKYVLVQTDEFVEGIFYINEENYNYVVEFYHKLNDANLAALITDFDYIEESCDRIILRKYIKKDV